MNRESANKGESPLELPPLPAFSADVDAFLREGIKKAHSQGGEFLISVPAGYDPNRATDILTSLTGILGRQMGQGYRFAVELPEDLAEFPSLQQFFKQYTNVVKITREKA